MNDRKKRARKKFDWYGHECYAVNGVVHCAKCGLCECPNAVRHSGYMKRCPAEK